MRYYSIDDPELAHAMEAYRLEQPPDMEDNEEEEKVDKDWCRFYLWRLMERHGKHALIKNLRRQK
jgi:hypothetical protein